MTSFMLELYTYIYLKFLNEGQATYMVKNFWKTNMPMKQKNVKLSTNKYTKSNTKLIIQRCFLKNVLSFFSNTLTLYLIRILSSFQIYVFTQMKYLNIYFWSILLCEVMVQYNFLIKSSLLINSQNIRLFKIIKN